MTVAVQLRPAVRDRLLAVVNAVEALAAMRPTPHERHALATVLAVVAPLGLSLLATAPAKPAHRPRPALRRCGACGRQGHSARSAGCPKRAGRQAHAKPSAAATTVEDSGEPPGSVPEPDLAALHAELSRAPPGEGAPARARRLARLELLELELPRERPPSQKGASLWAQKHLSLQEIELGKLIADDLRPPSPSYPGCVESAEPCWRVGCRHNLAADVNRFGNIKVTFPGWHIDEIPATCAIREARKGPRTVEQVGNALNLSAEAVRVIERDAWRKVERSRLIDPGRLWRGRRVPA